MARSVYVTGIDRGDGRQAVELGVMELLTRQVDRVGLFRPLVHAEAPGTPGADHVVELLRARYRIDLPPADLYGLTYEEAAALQAAQGQDELVSVLVDRFRALERRCQAVLVLGTDFADTNIPDELAFNARLANEFGAWVLPVVGGRREDPDSVVAEVRNAYRAYTDLGCSTLAMIANRVAPAAKQPVLRGLNAKLPVPVYVVPEELALAAPTVAQLVEATGAELLLGDAAGLARDVRGFVFGGAMLPTFLGALTEGALVVTPGDRADLLIGSLAAHAAGAPPIAGVLLTLDQHPGADVLALAARLAPGTPVAVVGEGSWPTAAALTHVEGMLSAASPRKAEIALGLFELHVDTAELTSRIELSRSDRVTPMMFEHELLEQARAARRHVVLPEGTEERVLRAAEILLRRNVCDLTLLGEVDAVRRKAASLGIVLPAEGAAEGSAENAADRARLRIVDPAASPLRQRFAELYAELRAHKGMTVELALDLVTDVSYFGTLMVQEGIADGMVSGAVHSTAATIRPAFEVIKTAPGAAIVSSVFFMCLADKVLVYGDCAVNPDPNAQQLADIAIQSAETAAQFGVEPRVALLSYSTGTSGSGVDVDKVRKATELVRQARPDLLVEGPIQYDAAVDERVAATKLPGSAVAGRATVLVFPDLNTGNNTYKAVQRSAGAVAVGPVLQGLRKPVNDLSRGALVQDIVNTVAITAIQAQNQSGAPAQSHDQEAAR
ncbi:phosphate acetyltransferase [Streptomyces tateyamensis]|uniref:Phosphate acetyltransferase n=1 Tax=Streptomyces tateyamensis TaxID=565073 RepID=A0A2V4P5X9_9ACTN|nr:phosphate acetyltransferase [Streptomyces tateyamensis]PYC78416.1 phosphate acetyltransferase [Streptomyces tateyamensis]